MAGYWWLYADIGSRDQARDAVALARECGLNGILWIDVEDYTDGSAPSLQDIRDAIDECEKLGVRPGIYSGQWVFDKHFPNVTEFAEARVPLWVSQYDGVPNLESFKPFGGWTRCAGKQYSADQIDRSVFDAVGRQDL